MSNTFNKAKVGFEDFYIDSGGVNQSFPRNTSSGGSQNIQGLNASLIPLILATRTLGMYDGGNLSAGDIDSAITQICSSLASIHKFSNQAVLDGINSFGSGAVISSSERNKLNSITDIGSGGIITEIERNKLTEIVGLTQAQIDAITNVSNILPVGTVIQWATATPPTGFLECNGAAVSRSVYSDLFGVLALTYGAGDGSTTFNLPDYRGEFLRGWDHGATNDPDSGTRTDRGDTTVGDAVGTKQQDELVLHGHPFGLTGNDGWGGTSGGISTDSGGSLTSYPEHTGAVSATAGQQIGGKGGSESRPRNVNVMYCIRHSI
jgi:microcystin-dependent protein